MMNWLKKKRPVTFPVAATPRKTALMMQLEPRIMFDGAAVVTAIDIAHHEVGVVKENAAVENHAADAKAVAAASPQLTESPHAETINARHEIIFVDTSVENYQSLLADLNPNAEVVLITAQQDGLKVIADTLAGRSNVDAIHILSHGDTGRFRLGAEWIDSTDIAARHNLLRSIGNSLSDNGDILLYGCNVGADDAGVSFVLSLSEATGADVAASTDPTGAASRGGDWELEYHSGLIESSLFTEGQKPPLYDGLLATDQNFDGVAVGGLGSNSVTINDLTYFNNDSFNIAVVNDGFIAAGGDHALGYRSSNPNTSTVVGFKTADGSEFKLNSFVMDRGFGSDNIFTVKAYRNSVEVASTTVDITSGTATLNVSGNSSWENIDEVRISGADLDVDIDDLDFSPVPAPTVTSVNSSTSNGTYKVGDTVSVQVNFSAPVTVTGTPQLTLETGTVDRVVNYASGSGTSTLTFTYTVLAGDITADLDYQSTGALGLNGGTIKNGSGIDAIRTLAAPGAANSLGNNKAIVIDGVAPTVTSVNSSTANGTYKAGDAVSIQVNFSEAVTVTGTPQLTLETGTTDQVVNYASGSGTSTLTFTYTVQAGDTSADLDYQSTTALAPNGGTIKDAAGNNGTLTLASPGAANSLGNNKAIVVDTTAPTVSSVNSSTANGTYKVGDTVSIQVNFSEAVTVTGTPQLTLETGTTDQVVNYVSGSGTSTLTFTYTVQAGDTSADLDYQSTAALATNGGTIRDAAGNNATLTLASPGAANSLGNNRSLVIDGVAPTLQSDTVPANATYTTGQNLDFTVTYSEAVTVNTGGGTPYIGVTLDTGGSVQAAYFSGSGTTTLTFRYTVAAGNVDSNGIAVATSITLNSGTIRDAAGNNAATTGITFASTASVLVEAVAPTVSSINRVSTATTNATSVDYTVTFSENVSGVDTSDFSLTSTGTATGSIASVAQVNASTYTVTVNTISGDGTLRLDLKNSGTGIADTPGNAITTGFTSGQTYTIDNTAPTVTSVNVPANATYIAGQNLNFTVNFGENVTVNTGGGTPYIAITLDTGGTVQANYLSGSGTSALVFRYTVASGNLDTNGISVGSTVVANGGTLRDVAGNNATLTLNSVGSTTNVLVDAVVPTVTSVNVPPNTNFMSGQNLNFTVNFSENVTVNTGGGTPRIAITLATGTVYANYFSGSGTAALVFRYTTASGQFDGDGITLAGSIEANGGTLRDATGNDAALTLNNVGSTTSVLVDAVAPTVSSINRVSGTPTNATSVDYTVTFSEDVNGVDTADFQLTTTGTASGSIASISQLSQSVYTVTVNTITGNGTLRLDLKNAGTGIDDNPGNIITTGFTSGQTYTIDTTVPAVTSVNVPANATYTVGQNLDFTVNFGENVTVNTGGGTPRIALTLNTGGTVYASYLSGSGTNALVFRYTIASGTADPDGITVAGSIDANGGTLRDVASNNANLTLNSVGSTASVLVDAIVPAVNSVGVPANATYAAGQNLDFTVNFSENVTVNTGGGTPYIGVTLDTGGTVNASYISGSGTSALVFRYTVATGNVDGNGIALAASITANGGTLRDAIGNDATLTLNSVGSTTAVLVDGVAPSVSSINRVSSATTNATSVDYTVTFSENVSGVDTSDFSLTATGAAAGGIASVATVSGNVYTVTVNTISGNGTLRLDLKNAGTGITDAPGNAIAAGFTSGQTYTIDNTAPTATIVVADTALAAGETSLVTITFSEAVTGFTNADLTIANGTLSTVSSTDGGITWTATLTPTASITDTTNLITLANTGVQDTAGNTGTGTTDSNNYAIDTARPTATVVVADSSLTIGETSLVTITFSEAVTGFTNADLTVANGTLSAVSSSDGGITWTATLTPTVSITDTTNLITLANTGVQDAAGNVGTATTDSNNYAIDNVRPTATIVVADAALAAGETSLVTITFSEAATGFTNADLTIANGTLSAVSSSDGGITWTATLTPTASITDTTNLITLSNGGIADTVGNAGIGNTNSNNYAIDTQRPTATIVVADTALAVGETSLVTITMSEAVANFDNADLSAANGTLSTAVTSDGGITWTATLTPTVGITDTTNVVTFDSTGVIDGAGNVGAGAINSNNYAIDTARPTATIVVADNALVIGETSLVTITFSEAVTGFTNADLTVANGTLSAVSSSDGGITWTATLTPTSGITDTTNLVTLANTGVQDAAGNAGAGTTDSNNYAIDSVRPTVAIVVSDTALAAGETSLVTITFNEAVTGFTNADLTIANGTLSAVSSSDGGITWTATLTPTAAIADATNLITLANTGVQDVAGNGGTGTTDSNNYAIDTDIPAIASVSVPSNGIYVATQNLDFTLNLSEIVTVNTAGGTPRIAVTLDTGGTVYANYLSGSGTTALLFRATVAAGQLDTNGLSVGSALDTNGGNVRDTAGNNAALALNGVGNTTGVQVDAIAPTASSIVLVETLPTNAQTLHYTLTFSENVSGVDVNDLQVVTTDSVTATITSVAPVDARTYTVTLDNVQGSGTLRVDLKGSGTGVADVAGNPLAAGLAGTVHTLGGVTPDILSKEVGNALPAPSYSQTNFQSSLPSLLAATATELPSISSLATVVTMPTLHNVVVASGRSFDLPVLGQRLNDFSNWSVVELRSANGAPLPTWIYYNSTTGKLQGTPPANFRGTLQIEVVITDSHGHRTVDTVQLRFGDAGPRAHVDRLSTPQKHAASKLGLDAQFARHARNAPPENLRELHARDLPRVLNNQSHF